MSKIDSLTYIFKHVSYSVLYCQCCSLASLTAFVAFGEVFGAIGVREPQPAASEAFTKFGEAHRNMERFAIKMLKTVKRVSLGLSSTFIL